MKIRKYPKGVSEFADRHGKVRIRGRRAGSPTYYFKEKPPGEAFEEELRTWLAGAQGRSDLGASRVRQGSISYLVARYYRSAYWVSLEKSTQATYRGIIERFRAEHGERSIAGLQRKQIRALVNERQATPAAANNLLRMLRILMKFAVEEELRSDDPTIGVRPITNKTDGFHSWTDAEISAFEKAHPVGTRARLAFALLLYTGQRRSDVIGMGRQNLRDGRIAMRQQKTGVFLEVPVHPQLARIIAATPTDNMTFLVVRGGRPFTAAGFGNWFRQMCDIARLPKHCAAHGLRKAAARRLAEAGCTPHQIAAITGHKSLREVERYAAAASQLKLAKEAVRALGMLDANKPIGGPDSEQKLANSQDRLAKKRSK